MFGNLDRFDDTIAGWACEENDNEGRVEIGLFLDGNEVYCCAADLYRMDLAQQFDNVYHGFSFDLASIVKVGTSGFFEVFALGKERWLLGSKYMAVGRQVVEGLDGWLFLANDSNNVNLRISGGEEISPEIYQKSIWSLLCRQAILDLLKVPYWACVAPEKSVACDRLRGFGSVSRARPACQIVDGVRKSGGRIAYPIDIFSERCESIYCRTDTHMQGLGQQLAAEMVFAAMGWLIPNRRLQPCVVPDFPGDLGNKMDPPMVDRAIRYSVPNDESHFYAKNPIPSLISSGGRLTGSQVIVKCKGGRNGRLLLIGTSSAYEFLPIISQHFSETVFFWSNSLDLNYLNAFQPSLVIWMVTERVLPVVLDDIHQISTWPHPYSQ